MGTNGNSPPVGSSLSSTLPIYKHDRARSQPMPDLLYGGAHRLNSDLRASTSTNSYTGRDPNAHPQLSDYLGSEVVNQGSNLGNKDSVVSPFVGEQIGNKDNEVSPFAGEQIGKDSNSTDDASTKLRAKHSRRCSRRMGLPNYRLRSQYPRFPADIVLTGYRLQHCRAYTIIANQRVTVSAFQLVRILRVLHFGQYSNRS